MLRCFEAFIRSFLWMLYSRRNAASRAGGLDHAYGHVRASVMSVMCSLDDLEPTWTPPGAVREWQAEDMRRLRQLSDEGPARRDALEEALLGLAYGRRSLCDEDMARAARLSVAGVQQGIRRRLSLHVCRQQRELAVMVARHSPPSFGAASALA